MNPKEVKEKVLFISVLTEVYDDHDFKVYMLRESNGRPIRVCKSVSELLKFVSDNV